jgi:hypothetical protein
MLDKYTIDPVTPSIFIVPRSEPMLEPQINIARPITTILAKKENISHSLSTHMKGPQGVEL